MRAILLFSALLATGLLAPLAAADDDVGQVCLPQTDPDAPVYGCASWGTRSSPVYDYDVNSGPWTQDCVWLVCVTHPNPYLYPVVLTYAPIPYSEGDLYVKCLKGQYCHVAWDTRDPIVVTAAALPVLA